MTLDEAKVILPDIQQTHGLASERWGESFHIETGRAEICARDRGIDTPIMHILPACSYDDRLLAINAPRYIKALLLLLSEAFRVIRELKRELAQAQETKSKDYAAECAMKCNEASFGLFLQERHQLQPPITAESVTTAVKHALKVRSRKELNNNAAAAHRWTDLRSEYDAWRRT